MTRAVSNQQRWVRGAQPGFTIIELLIVIVIIAILAAITIVAYNGITQRAHAAALQSDLKNGYNLLGASNVTKGTYPADLSTINGGNALSPSPGDTFTYNVSSDGTAYCLQASGYGMSYFVTSDNSTPQTGTCNGTTGVPGSGQTAPLHQNGGVVTTLAGSGTAGFVNGTGTAAEFNLPSGVAVDASANVYVADASNNAIRKISPVGVVTTLAGSGTAGFVNGTGTAAEFNFPHGVAVDASGNIYVADANNNAIREISPSGVVTTLAGSGTAGFVNGTGTAAEFNFPHGVAVDASGNVYVADTFNQAIRKISAAGVVTTLAGSQTQGFVNGTGAAAEFNYPFGVAVDASGNVYVADTGNNAIRKISPAGVVTTLAGSGTAGFVNGTGTAAEFNSPHGVAVDASGNVYVADASNNAIRKISPAGVVTTLAGSGTRGFVNGTGTAAEFNSPTGVVVDASGNVYVADYANNAIRLIK